MRGMSTAFALCALFTLALVTVRLKTRAVLLGYAVARLEAYEEILVERLEYLGWREAVEAGVMDLMDKSVRYEIPLCLKGPGGRPVPLIERSEGNEALE